MSSSLEIRFALQHPGFSLDVDVQVPAKGITGVFGTSGAGKTTLLRCLAGLEQPTTGRLVVKGATWQDSAKGMSLPVHRRHVGYVFQEPRLFGHLDVIGNLEYGSRRAGARRARVHRQEIIDMCELGGLLGRRTDKLSGGEAQRVAIARALCGAPELLLMDEPLASLDDARKQEILPLLERLHQSLEIPVIYVSHNIDETCRLCDQLVVMEQGKIVANGELQSVLTAMDVPVLAGREAGSVIEATVRDVDPGYELTTLGFSGGELLVPGIVGEPGAQTRVRIRANDVSLCRQRPAETTILNVLPASIDHVGSDTGPTVLIRLQLGHENLLARITRRSLRNLDLREGDEVLAQIKSVTVRR
jgi:molybdate transport system ATP-binding protein